jgi:hypothetical protein
MAASATLAKKSVQYLKKNYKYLAQDPSFFWMKTVARFELARDLKKRVSTVPLGFPMPEPANDVGHVISADGTDGALSVLEREGYYVGLKLAPRTLQNLLRRARESTCYGNRDPGLPFRIDELSSAEQRYGRSFKLGSYFKQPESWPEFQAICEDDSLRAIARDYLGCAPVYMRSDLMWSFPRAMTTQDRLANAQVFHCDINDFRTLKFFFYLTQVGPGGGPHAYIKKGPRQRTLKHQLLGQRCAAIPDEELERTYGAEQIVTVCGPAGLGFAGDPYYFHRGTTPTTENRLLLQIEMGCKRYRTWYFETG